MKTVRGLVKRQVGQQDSRTQWRRRGGKDVYKNFFCYLFIYSFFMFVSEYSMLCLFGKTWRYQQITLLPAKDTFSAAPRGMVESRTGKEYIPTLQAAVNRLICWKIRSGNK